MAQCLLETFIYGAPGIIFNYLWNRIGCANSDKERVVSASNINLCHAPLNLKLASAKSSWLKDPGGEQVGSCAWWRLVCLPASPGRRLPLGSLGWALHRLCQLPTAFDKAQCFLSVLGLWTSLANRKWIKLNWGNFFILPWSRFFYCNISNLIQKHYYPCYF